jgi:PAS domain S-box-containing protein
MMATNIRVLILDDRAEDAELMVYELKRSQFDPDWRRVDTESEYNAHLGWQPDVILADYNMPLLDAPRALDLLRELDLDIPFIVVSGAIGEDVAVAMMRRGATDYLLKDRLTRLGAAVRHALDERQLREETARAGQALRASELRFYSFMNNNPALALIKDEEGRILYVNNTCEPMWGLAPAECLGKTNHELWPADVADKLRARDQAVVSGREPSRSMEEVILRGRIARQMLSFRFPFTEADGQCLLGVVSFDMTEQVGTQKALADALAAKELLLKEVHHRVKNNLQIISSLLAMQAESLAGPGAVKALRESQERVQCMALIHERLNGDDQPDRLDFAGYVETLARDLFYSYGADSSLVQLRFELEPVWLGLRQAIPCGLILNELLTNAFKYAFPGGRAGEIVVSLRCEEGELIKLGVRDDGVGLPEGWEYRTSKSLGLRIVDILSRQLDANTQWEAGENGGAFFSLTFARDGEECGEIPAAAGVSSGVELAAKKPGQRADKLGQTA